MKFIGNIKGNMDFNNTPIDWSVVHKVVSKSRKIMLTTHENPDGDGLGAEIGIYYHLKEIGSDVRIINYSPISEVYHFLDTDHVFEHYNSQHHDAWIKEVDLVIIFDVGDFKRIRTICDAISKFNLTTMNIDHHPHPKNHLFSHNVVDLSAAATGCLVFDYLKFARKEPISKKSLEGIYTAVMTDTGCFRHSNTDEKCHKIAIECLDIGIETNLIYRHIYENSSRARIELMGMILTDLNYELEGKLAWFIISRDMMKKVNASKSDIDGFSDMVRSIRGVEVAIMISEQSYNNCRINFRSKGNLKINHIANMLGGGGHAFASGAMVKGSLSSVQKKVVNSSVSILKEDIASLAQ
jgi:phosphoesterase RecJ-like protein